MFIATLTTRAGKHIATSAERFSRHSCLAWAHCFGSGYDFIYQLSDNRYRFLDANGAECLLTVRPVPQIGEFGA